MEENKREIRNTTFQVTANDEKRTVEGYAMLFDTKSDGLGFVEVIERGALDGVVSKSDVLALLNHDERRGVLARSKNGSGSLTLAVDSKGLKYKFESPNSSLGDELLENIRRGEVSESSFAFTVEEDKWEKREDDTWVRTISKIGRLYDVSPVYSAAYSKTSVYLRGKEKAEEDMKNAIDEESRKAEEEEKRKRDDQAQKEKEDAALASYYENIEQEFLN